MEYNTNIAQQIRYDKKTASFLLATGSFSKNLSDEGKKQALRLANNWEKIKKSGVVYETIEATAPNVLISIDHALYNFVQEKQNK